MSFLLGLLKNPRVIAWVMGVALAIMVGLFTYGTIQYVQVKSLKSDLAVAEQNVKTLETSNAAKDVKYRQLQRDMEDKQLILEGIQKDKEKLAKEYRELETQLAGILDEVEGVNPETLPEVKKKVETSVINSYACIEVATGNEGAKCE